MTRLRNPHLARQNNFRVTNSPASNREHSINRVADYYSPLNVRDTSVAQLRNICYPPNLPIMASSGVDIAALKQQLYDACLPSALKDPRKYFNQSSIFDLGIIPNNDVNLLLKVTQALVDEKLFKILQSEGLAWRLRTQEEARKFVSSPTLPLAICE